MATLKELRDERLRKLAELTELGVNPYPAQATRTHTAQDITGNFDGLQGQVATVTGRILGIRKFGKIAFIVLKDASGQLQLFLKDGLVQPLDAIKNQLGLEQLNLLDSGDFIEATGAVIKTQTGETSLEVTNLRLLTKTLRPMPTAQEGFTNKEERLRRRYVDTNVNQDVYDRFVRRSKFWQATREFLLQHDFLEINIPVLEHTTGGADANPFVTHMDALDQDFYLRISHELPLKRLLGGGYEKVFDIGPRFRNENYSDEHLPEHIAMEWYWTYADWRDGMKFMTELYRFVLQNTFGTLQFKLGDFEIDLAKAWEEWDYVQTIKDRYGIDPLDTTIAEVKKALSDNKLEVEQTENIARGIDKLWKNIRKDVVGPIWLINTPLAVSPLSKINPDRPLTTQRFQPVIAGSELGNGFSELNDPLEQLQRFVEQQGMRDAGDDEAMMLDIDYVEMLEYGMPPACGWGYSERVFWIFEGVTAREGVPFPQLRTEIDPTTKALYPEVSFHGPRQSSKSVAAKDLPVSAAEQGTRKLYLDDYGLLSCNARIVAVEPLDDHVVRLVIDQTCLYPGGGGQPNDTGTIAWQDGSLTVVEATKDEAGVIHYTGPHDGSLPAIDTDVTVQVDAPRRMLNSNLHCAGHLIDYAVKRLGKDWKPGKGAHYPDMCFVEYGGTYDPAESEDIARAIEATLQAMKAEGGAIGVRQVPSESAHEYSDYIPDAILSQYQNVHITTYPHDFNVCCGGTHLADVSQLGDVTITKVKKKDGRIRVSYKVA